MYSGPATQERSCPMGVLATTSQVPACSLHPSLAAFVACVPRLKPCMLAASVAASLGASSERRQSSTLAPAGDAPAPLSVWARARKLNKMFEQGQPSNNPKLVGLVVHNFDDTENFWDAWKPCVPDKAARIQCSNGGPWWSTSVINVKQKNTFGDSGIILSPDFVNVSCSFPSDAGTEFGGCHRLRSNVKAQNASNHLKDMLVGSMKGGMPYNEVVVHTDDYLSHLPQSVAAIVYNLRGMGDEAAAKAVRTYVRMLDNYDLDEQQIPLLRANWPDSAPAFGMYPAGMEPQEQQEAGVPPFTDMSANARKMMEEHGWAKASKKELEAERQRRRSKLRKLEQLERLERQQKKLTAAHPAHPV